MFPVSFFVISVLFLTSCVSTHTALQNIEHGLNKQGVRNTIGKPFSVGRLDGQDRWTYKFRWNSQEYTRDVFFDEGRVQKVGPLTPYPNYEKKMTEAEDLEEYEINATLYQRQKEAGFRKINSVKKKDSDDAVQFCSDIFWGDTAEQHCKDIMRDNIFVTNALDFCTNGIWLDFHKRDCLEITANKLFSESALRMCGIPSWAINKLQCLYHNRQYTNLSMNEDRKEDILIFNCSGDQDVQFKLQFPHKTEEEDKHLSPMAVLKLYCTETRCPTQTEQQPIQLSLQAEGSKTTPHSLQPGQIYTLNWDAEKELWNVAMETGNIVCD